MSNLSLFDVKPAPDCAPAVELKPSDVRRRIEHRYGPFPRLRCMTDAERTNSKTHHSALIVGKYQIVELQDGSVFAEFSGGERRKAHGITGETIERMLGAHEWREVRG